MDTKSKKATKLYKKEHRQNEIAAEALKDLRKGHNFGKLLYTKREELYDRP
ncbi:hypothetical protein HYX14_00535 [Candidatus Woesearchaeota archaeon]|nr:hypothetical protein [Candidatus Woesearchaeota archaeon]